MPCWDPPTDNRLFLDALLLMARSGGRWRDLPQRLGDYRSVKRRYYRWIEMGMLDEILAVLAREADLAWLMIDSTIVRAHQHAADARKGKGADAQGLGQSRGGLSTKIHAAAETLGLPIRLIGSPGQCNDIAFAHDLVDGFEAKAAIADKGYDADHLCDRIAYSGKELVIRQNATEKSSAAMTLTSIRSAIASSASSQAQTI